MQFNTVSGSGLDGIAVFGNRGTNVNNTGTVINGNSVTGNGFHNFGHRKGSGIILFLTGNQTQVTNNAVTGNAASGIRVGSRLNTITGNVATGNDAAGAPQQAYDLYDLHFQCDRNVWANNTYDTAKPACAGD